MKGFIHVMEIIIVFVLLFLLILQFSNVPRAYEDWPRARLSLQAYDALYTLDGTGLDWSDPGMVEAGLDNVFGGTSIMYMVEKEDSLGVRTTIVGGEVGQDPVNAYLFRVLDLGEGTNLDFEKVILTLGYLYS